MAFELHDRIWGSLLGGAVGDALGAPMECLHYQDVRRIFDDYQGFEDLTEDRCAQVYDTSRLSFVPGKVTDDTVLADVLLDCIIKHKGEVTAYAFAEEWEQFETPIADPAGDQINRLQRVHWIERIPYLRNRLREIPKRELGHGEANATNAIMFIAPVGLLCAGDPLEAELMAVDVTSVNQHGRPRDIAGAYAAALAACFLPGRTPEDISQLALAHTRDWRHTKEIRAMLDLGRTCENCDEFIERYYSEIIGQIVPYQDLQHEDTRYCVSWNSAEVLGPILAMFLISCGEDARAFMLGCAKIGRDADTICRCAGGLIGAYRGASAIPAEWVEFVLSRNDWLRLEDKAKQLTSIVETRLRNRLTSARAILGK